MITPDIHPVQILFDMIDVLAIKPNSKLRSWKAMFRITFSKNKIAIFELECEPPHCDADEAMVVLTSANCYENLHEDNFDKYFRGDWIEYLPKGKMNEQTAIELAGAFLIEETGKHEETLKNKMFPLDELTDSVYKFLKEYQAKRDRDRIRWRNELNKMQELIDEYDSKS